MNVAVTGAEGFIGSSIVNAIHQEHEVTAIDYIHRSHAVNIPESVKFVNADLSNSSLHWLLQSKTDLIYHMAVVNIVEIDRAPILERKNIDMTLNALEYARQHDCSLVMGSSASVYGSGTDLKEDSPLKPMCLYAVGKICSEIYAKKYADLYGLNIQVLRFSNIYGDRTDFHGKIFKSVRGVIEFFMEQAVEKLPLTLINPEHTRDFTFIDDAVTACLATSKLKGFNIFNVASGVETSIGELVETFKGIFDYPLEVVKIPERRIDNLHRRSLSIEKISPIWIPEYRLLEGLKKYKNDLQFSP